MKPSDRIKEIQEAILYEDPWTNKQELLSLAIVTYLDECYALAAKPAHEDREPSPRCKCVKPTQALSGGPCLQCGRPL